MKKKHLFKIELYHTHKNKTTRTNLVHAGEKRDEQDSTLMAENPNRVDST